MTILNLREGKIVATSVDLKKRGSTEAPSAEKLPLKNYQITLKLLTW